MIASRSVQSVRSQPSAAWSDVVLTVYTVGAAKADGANATSPKAEVARAVATTVARRSRRPWPAVTERARLGPTRIADLSRMPPARWRRRWNLWPASGHRTAVTRDRVARLQTVVAIQAA